MPFKGVKKQVVSSFIKHMKQNISNEVLLMYTKQDIIHFRAKQIYNDKVDDPFPPYTLRRCG